ncbi:MAG: hypothetical protein IKX31_12045 [Muribaculaceae bacterium]|nr:hypothetical protein [Muribaculaceae bacterium]
MESKDAILYLSSFAPLIQLWAGICLLFFYCELLDKSPFNSAKTQLFKLYGEIYDELTTKYQVFIPENDSIYNCDLDMLKEDKHWDYFRASIYCMAVFSFFYSLIILILAGIEKHNEYGIYFQALQTTNTIALIYFLLNRILYKTVWGQSKLYAILCAMCLGLYVPFHFIIIEKIQIGYSWSHTSISVYTLFTCISGLFLILIHLCVDWYTIYRCKKSIKRIKKNFNLWIKLPFKKSSGIYKLKLIWMLIVNLIRSFVRNKDFELDMSNKKILEIYLKQKVKKELVFLRKKIKKELQ